ncbi:hypothetical protein UVI_02053450 [Ustilaginoidea virens]|uniref:NWD NACHT-NTPase N-terminal domain-containing protein n=1 Tax=Ustilaginoidea virens TaxID=1159556 RepID=A0A1B5L091_USTVR|nr:hypothetical protein UVI_02053450 [Ustilaginoidea virens]
MVSVSLTNTGYFGQQTATGPEVVEPANLEAVPLSLPEQIWRRAYDALKKDEPSCVKEYGKVLQKAQGGLKNWDIPKQIQKLAQSKSDEVRKMWMMIYAGMERSKKIAGAKGSLSSVVKIVENFKSVINAPLKFSPGGELLHALLVSDPEWDKQRIEKYKGGLLPNVSS